MSASSKTPKVLMKTVGEMLEPASADATQLRMSSSIWYLMR